MVKEIDWTVVSNLVEDMEDEELAELIDELLAHFSTNGRLDFLLEAIKNEFGDLRDES